MSVCCVVIFLHFFENATKSCDLRGWPDPLSCNSIELNKAVYSIVWELQDFLTVTIESHDLKGL